MITIYKYPLLAYPHHIDLPKDAQFLCVQTQAEKPQMWFMVNTDAPKERRNFIALATGEEIDTTEKLEYRGTFQLGSYGRLVYHVFEVLQHMAEYNIPGSGDLNDE